ncbi:MAG: N-acetyltransferase [Gammaproteobacteria bacterium]|nr:N-acetyltransferase [Gammaproteobacteria bacterium]
MPNQPAHALIERAAQPDDVAGIRKLLDHYAAMGDLLPRREAEIITNLSHFRVLEVGGDIVGCGSLEHFTDELAEIRSLMVAPGLKRNGQGSVLLNALIDIARQRGVGRLMALTYVPEFFHKFGFHTVSKDIFPEKIWGICVNCYKFHNCDEIAVLLELQDT